MTEKLQEVFYIIEEAITRTTDCKPLLDNFTLARQGKETAEQTAQGSDGCSGTFQD